MTMTPKFLIPYADIAIMKKKKAIHSVKMQIRRWRFNPHKLRKVLINILDPGNGIGDYIQSSPLAMALKQASPDVEISYLVSGEKEKFTIFELFPVPVSVISLHPSQVNQDFLSTFAENVLRPKNFDLIIHSHPENPWFSKTITQKGGFLNSMGYFGTEMSGKFPFLTMMLPNPGPQKIFPERLFPYDSALQRILDVKINWEARVVLQDRAEMDEISNFIEKPKKNGYKILGLHPGCKITDRKRRWSVENFKQLASCFRKQYGSMILVFGGPHEEEDVRMMVNNIGDSEVKAVIGQPLLKVASLINQCDVFVSNDSGLMNLSMALGISSIAICGPSCIQSLQSLYPKGVFLGDKMPCCPCRGKEHYMSCIKGLGNSAECLDLIEPDEVIEHIKALNCL